jgi:hypothetical protein
MGGTVGLGQWFQTTASCQGKANVLTLDLRGVITGSSRMRLCRSPPAETASPQWWRYRPLWNGQDTQATESGGAT